MPSRGKGDDLSDARVLSASVPSHPGRLGEGTLDVVVRMLAGLWGEGRAPIPLELVPLTEGQVLDAGEFTIGCFPVRHRDTDSFGFSFESQVRRHLRPDRLAALRVPDGPVRKELAEGRPVTLADGGMVDPIEVLAFQKEQKRRERERAKEEAAQR